MNIKYFDLIDLLDDHFDDDDQIDHIFLGFSPSIPTHSEDHGVDCFNFWKERI